MGVIVYAKERNRKKCYKGNHPEQYEENEIINALRKLTNGRFSGKDDVTGERLKYGCSFLTEWLYDLFNIMCEGCIVPGSWKNAVIVALK